MLPFTLETKSESGESQCQQTFYLPQSWTDISYGQYLDIIGLQRDETQADQQKAVRILSILVEGLTPQMVEATSFGLVIPLFTHLDFLQTEPQGEPLAHVRVDEVNYYPQMLETMGELVKYDRIDTQFRENPEQKWPYILALLLRKASQVSISEPVIPWYKRWVMRKPTASASTQVEAWMENDLELEKRARLFRQRLNPVQVSSLAAFFLRSAEVSQTFSQHSSSLDVVRTQMNAILADTLAKSMGGNPRWMTLNRILRSMMRYCINLSSKS